MGQNLRMAAKLGFKHIEVIHAVVLTGSVTGAAARLHVTQPAISNILRDAEERLGCQLFDRKGGRLVPTPLADQLFDEIERSFTGLAAINEFCEQVRLSQRRHLRVACTPAFAAAVLPLLAVALQEGPGPVPFLSVHSRVAHHVAALVGSRKADIGFALEVADVPGVVSEVLCELPLHCYLPAGHDLARERVIKASQLRDEPMISLSRIEGIHDVVTHAFRGAGGLPVPVAECPAAITACAMVAAGLGFTLFDILPATLFESTRMAVRPFVPATCLTYRAYWLKTEGGELDAARLVRMAKAAVQQAVAQANRAMA